MTFSYWIFSEDLFSIYVMYTMFERPLTEHCRQGGKVIACDPVDKEMLRGHTEDPQPTPHRQSGKRRLTTKSYH